jgi:hypothetical protein
VEAGAGDAASRCFENLGPAIFFKGGCDARHDFPKAIPIKRSQDPDTPETCAPQQ